MLKSNDKLVKLGSATAKAGFRNEKDIAKKFNHWQIDEEAKTWLKLMNYSLENIEHVEAAVLSGYKADINLQIQVTLKTAFDTENIQVKLVSNKKGFNQIDKRWLKTYAQLWSMPQNIFELLQYFCGELKPYKSDTKDTRRMFLTEFTEYERTLILEWFAENKILILSDCIKGRGEFSAEWILVAQILENNQRWVLKNINEVLNFYGQGNVAISPRGSLNIGKITMQRKGGDNGRQTANMLQFKIDPMDMFNI
ncbi:MAG: hypothetical protein FWF50_01220 [Defluviitaleaceae bacterium]|nr:hypothetical protein [Defluviitaleaceae bacterium]